MGSEGVASALERERREIEEESGGRRPVGGRKGWGLCSKGKEGMCV